MSPVPPTQADLLTALAQELSQAPTEESTAAAVIDRAVELVDDADYVSITLKSRRDHYVTLAASDDRSRQLDELQYTLREGPCVDAADGREWQRSGDVTRDERWPRWGPKAGELGVRSLLSVRLLSGDAAIGGLNFYARPGGKFNARDDVDFAILYATHVALALSSSREVANLQTALHSRHMIGFAQGILSERFSLDMDRSFDLLRRYSSVTNIKLADLAEQIVRTRRLPEMVGIDPTPTSPPS